VDTPPITSSFTTCHVGELVVAWKSDRSFSEAASAFMVKTRHIHASAAMCRTEFVGGMIIGIGTVQEFSRHKVKFSTAAKLTHAR
jgi:hypothetical protein